MHGCLFWRSQHISNQIDLMQKFNSDDLSNLITWQDLRCDEEFLKGLPSSDVCPTPISSANIGLGFGCATIFWLNKYNPKFLKNYDCCGTIGDYLVARLCSLAKPLMSNQNCTGWGYFNPQIQNWDLPTLTKGGFPVQILPVVACPGALAGKLTSNCLKIPGGTNVNVALGDMQCSVMSCGILPNEAVLNISTSAQLSMLVRRETKTSSSSNQKNEYLRPGSVARVPYFKNQDLLTSASLNGGDVFAYFVKMLTEWTRHFVSDVDEEKVYEQLISKASNVDPSAHHPLCIPTLFGERHNPASRASFYDIGVSDMQIPLIARSIIRGILMNLRSMFETGNVFIKDIKLIRACGGAFRKNKLFKELLSEVFSDIQVQFMEDADAAYGAVLSVYGTW